jgi:hypothetical protein
MGCLATSNPESTINWFKLSSNSKFVDMRGKRSNLTSSVLAVNNSKSESEYVLVDVSNPRYQIHKYKQAYQIASYLKIKVIYSHLFKLT